MPDFRLSRAETENLSPDYLYWAIIEPLWPTVGIDDIVTHIAEASAGQRAMFAVTFFTRLVSNGGLAGFVYDLERLRLLPEVLAGYQELGVSDKAETLQKVMGIVFPGDALNRLIASTADDRDDYLDQQLDLLDNDVEDVLMGESALFPYFDAYIEKHPEAFFLP